MIRAGVPADSEMVAVIGFGRSGTTWLSDIVSKASGSALLFEPFHPSVLGRSRELSYRSEFTPNESLYLDQQIRGMLNKTVDAPWLLRNHLPWPPHEIDPHLTTLIWDQIEILGFKSIRATMAVDWVENTLGAKILFMVRHPLAVVASVLRRANFWEFGWPATYEVFLANALSGGDHLTLKIREILRESPPVESDLERVATMWAITHAIAIPRCRELGIPLIRYEDLYVRPFTTARIALSHIGVQSERLLPTYLFTPAMTTIRTLHGKRALKNEDGTALSMDFFWTETLDPQQQRRTLEIVEAYEVTLYETDTTSVSTI